MDTSKATPRPWNSLLSETGSVSTFDGRLIVDTNGSDFASVEDADNAALIVTAVNVYERAIQLLTAARDFIQDNDLQEYTVAYDMTRCDGECLLSDIDALLSRTGSKS